MSEGTYVKPAEDQSKKGLSYRDDLHAHSRFGTFRGGVFRIDVKEKDRFEASAKPAVPEKKKGSKGSGRAGKGKLAKKYSKKGSGKKKR